MTSVETEDLHCERRNRPRRNRRIRMRFPLTVAVPAGHGRVRELQAHTVVVSHAGATLDVDEGVAVGLGVQLSPPFGGTLLAEVTGAWVDDGTGRHQVSVRLIDPQSWTTPEQFAATGQEGQTRASRLEVGARVWQMLADYAAFLREVGGEDVESGWVAERLLESALLADSGFQMWLGAKVEGDLRAWEETCVGEPAGERAGNVAATGR